MSKFTFNDIKFKTDKPTLEKALKLYTDKKVTKFAERVGDYTAVVIGTHPYNVSVSKLDYDIGNCDCYLGQKDTLCKHMVALAIYSIYRGKPLGKKEKEINTTPRCSKKKRELTEKEVEEIKKEITALLKFIKPYNGPSRIWFQYQDNLSEGCNRLAALICRLPVCENSAKILVNLLLRLDRKLCTGGVDDSDGTVGGFIEDVVKVLVEYSELEPKSISLFRKLINRNTCFGWEEELLKIYDEENKSRKFK